MNILFVTDRAPCPMESGMDLRLYHLASALAGAGRLSMAVVPPRPSKPERLAATRDRFGTVTECFAPADAAAPSGVWRREEWGGLGPALSEGTRRQLKELASSADVLWVERLGLALRTGLADPARAVVDIDDLHQQKYGLAAAHAPRLPARLRWSLAARRWQRRENAARHQFARVLVCSHPDRALLGNAPNVAVVPNGFDRLAPRTVTRQARIGFIGTLEYWANRDGLLWFLDQVWPAIHQRHPELEFRIAGKGRRSTDADRPGVRWLGFLDDADEEVRTWQAMIVPLRIGAGTRIKILEAFSRGCPVVSTRVGAYGIEAAHDEHLLLADTPTDLAAAVTRIVSEPGLGDRLTRAAATLFDQHYAWDRIEQQVAGLASSLNLRR